MKMFDYSVFEFPFSRIIWGVFEFRISFSRPILKCHAPHKLISDFLGTELLVREPGGPLNAMLNKGGLRLPDKPAKKPPNMSANDSDLIPEKPHDSLSRVLCNTP